MPPKLHDLLVRLGLVAASVTLTLLLAEGALRLAGYDYSPLAIQSREALEEGLPSTAGDARGYHLFQNEQFTYDPRLIWRPRPGKSVFNAQGFRGPELAREKPAGEVRVFAFGDSNTLGWGRRSGANWPEYLGELLTATDERVVTVNAGVWGYTVLQGKRRLEEALDLAPDIVLISFGSNDAHPVYRTDAEYREALLGASLPGLSRLKVVQVVLSFWDGVVTARSAAAESSAHELVHRVPPAEYRAHLDSIAALARRRGFECVFLTRPYRGSSGDRWRWKYWAPQYREATLAAARDNDVPMIDVYAEFRDRPELFHDESHFSWLGHHVAAKLVYEELAPIVARRAGLAASRRLSRGVRFAQRVEIDFGTRAARQHLSDGFSSAKNAPGRTAVRSRGSSSALAVAISPAAGPYLLAVDAMPRKASEPVLMAVSVNDTRVGELSVAGGWRSYRLGIPPGVLREGINRVDLSYSHREKEQTGERSRARSPAVWLDRLSLDPDSPAATTKAGERPAAE